MILKTNKNYNLLHTYQRLIEQMDSIKDKGM